MWHAEHTEITAASPEGVWRLWSDVATWPDWDHGVQRATLAGAFAAGASGRLKPRGGPSLPFTLTEVREPDGFVDETRLPFAVLRFEHRLARGDDGTLITHAVRITGPAAPLFARALGRGIARDLPAAVRRLAALAAEREAIVAGGS